MRSARFCSHNRDLSQVISLSHPLLSVLGVEKLRGWANCCQSRETDEESESRGRAD